MRLSATTFRIHRWLGWLVGLQVLVWVSGGLVFSLLPFKDWVKSGDVFKPPVVALSPGWAAQVAPALQLAADGGVVKGLSTVVLPQGPALKLSLQGQARPLLVPVDGSALRAPDAPAAQAFAQSLYRGSAAVVSVQRLALVPTRLGIVQETGGRGDVWRVGFDDALGSRIYLDGASGEFVAVRSEAWVWYDFFWRLHIMDYAGGEDFNGWLLRAASIVAWGLVLAGVVLAVLALRRRWQRRLARA